MGSYENKFVHTENGIFEMQISVEQFEKDCPKLPDRTFILSEENAFTLFLQPQREDPYYWFKEQVQKSKSAVPLARTLVNTEGDYVIVWRESSIKATESEPINQTNRNMIELRNVEYDVIMNGKKIHTNVLRLGGVYTLIVGSTNDTLARMITITYPNSMSVLWQIPQYIIMALAEVMFSVTGIEFAYTQAPVGMKTVMQACWMLTIAFGNIIVIVVAELSIFDSQASEFFLFAGLMFADMMIFMWLADNYESHDIFYSTSEVVVTDLKMKNQVRFRNGNAGTYTQKMNTY